MGTESIKLFAEVAKATVTLPIYTAVAVGGISGFKTTIRHAVELQEWQLQFKAVGGDFDTAVAIAKADRHGTTWDGFLWCLSREYRKALVS